MASTYSPSLQLTYIGDGDQAGTWGQTTNNNWTLIEQAVTGVDGISLTGLSSYTFFYVDEKNTLVSPYFDSEEEAVEWFNKVFDTEAE